MTAMFGLVGVGFVILFYGLTGQQHDVWIFIGMLVGIIGIIGSAVLSAHRRQVERRYEATRRRYQ